MKDNQSLEDLFNEAEEDLNKLKLYQKRKLIISIIRWTLTLVLYYIFWGISWVRWSLIIVIPLVLFNLYMITFGFGKVLSKFEVLKESIDKEGKK